MTLLRMVCALPDPEPDAVSGSMIIYIESHRPLGVLADRTSDTLADWSREHPDLRVMCRDRAGTYASAARVAAPQAQVADRWHLWHNLTAAVAKTVAGERTALRRARRRPRRVDRTVADREGGPARRGPGTRIIHRDDAGRRCRERRRRGAGRSLRCPRVRWWCAPGNGTPQ
ncbi:MAG TPA: transposase [Aldersonia sp.]